MLLYERKFQIKLFNRQYMEAVVIVVIVGFTKNPNYKFKFLKYANENSTWHSRHDILISSRSHNFYKFCQSPSNKNFFTCHLKYVVVETGGHQAKLEYTAEQISTFIDFFVNHSSSSFSFSENLLKETCYPERLICR